MECPTCGSIVSSADSICADCGMELQSGAPSPVPPAEAAPSSSSAPSPASDPGADATVVLPPGDANGIDFDSLDIPVTDDSSPQAAPPASAPVPAPASAPAPARLILKRNGALTEEVFPLSERVTVGRFDVDSGPVDIDMASLPEAAYVSRRHAEIWREEGQWKIKDLGARNGTFVSSSDGQFRRVTGEQSVSDGDEIALGNARFEFRVGGE